MTNLVVPIFDKYRELYSQQLTEISESAKLVTLNHETVDDAQKRRTFMQVFNTAALINCMEVEIQGFFIQSSLGSDKLALCHQLPDTLTRLLRIR